MKIVLKVKNQHNTKETTTLAKLKASMQKG